MARHRSYPIAFKRQISSGEVSLHGLAKRNDICRKMPGDGDGVGHVLRRRRR